MAAAPVSVTEVAPESVTLEVPTKGPSNSQHAQALLWVCLGAMINSLMTDAAILSWFQQHPFYRAFASMAVQGLGVFTTYYKSTRPT